MKGKIRWAFVIDKDEFVRLSLNKILRKYGFAVEEVEDFSQLERKKKEIEGGVVLADVDIEVLEKWVPLLKKWNDRFILMTPLITEDLPSRLNQIGIHHIIKKPVEPKLLKKAIQAISFPDEMNLRPSGKQREGSLLDQKGGEGR